MKTRHLEYFAEIVRNGSINGAAKNLYISPQALSAIVASLEGELGYPLLVRDRHGVSPTPEGEIIYNDLKNILPVIGEWNNLGKGSRTAYMEVYVSLALAASMNRFLIELEEKEPNFSVMLREARGKAIIDIAMKKNHTMAVIALTDKIYEEHRDRLLSQKLEMTKLTDDRFCAVLGKDYMPELKGEISPEDYSRMDYIFSSNVNDIIGKKYANEFGGKFISKVESHSSILCMTALNKGAVMLPEKAVKCEPLYISGMLRTLSITGEDSITRYYLVSPANDMLNEDEIRLKEAIIRYYSDEAEK